MLKFIYLFIACLFGTLSVSASEVITGADLIAQYLPMLKKKKVGILANHTSIVGDRHLVDNLLALGIDVRIVFAPEHGFRGDADAGANITSYKDKKTEIDVVSIYGTNKKPKKEDVRKLDIVLFDIQDVGLRYYTYLSSMHYMMETCAENGVPMIILDRPNPNGMYVDGPVLDMKYRSFVGMHPIPVVHGMTLGELALMINGEGWLENGVKCELTVIKCEGYTHDTRYCLPIKPSPNLPNMRSIYLYPSLCFFEGTPVSIGRGTDFPFQVFGHPLMPDNGFSFTPKRHSGAGNPKLKDELCYGVDLRYVPDNEEIISDGVNVEYLIEAYNELMIGDKFFSRMFLLLTGVDYVKNMIVEGCGADEIKACWKNDVESFRILRKPYLLYDE